MRLEWWLSTLPLRWRSLFRRDEVERELDEEIQDHVELEIERYVARGMDRLEARQLAMRAFGGVDQAKERCRDARGVGWIEMLVQDVRYGARSLRNAPAFTAVAVLTLALGTGANTAVFSLVDGVLLVGLPYPAPHQLVSVTGTYPMGAFAAMRDEVRTLDVAAYADGQAFTMRGAGEPARLAGARVSAEFFAVLGVKPALGRWLRPGEDEANHDRYVVLSHATWETRFGRDTSIVGRFVELDGVPREVVGVMPPSFQFPSSMTQVWVPLGLDPGQTVRHWAGDFMPVIGRLRAGAARLQAHADVRLFQSRIAGRFPWRMPADWNRDVTVIPLHEALVGAMRPRLLILSVAVLLVLVTACANVANLTLSRAVSREREIGIRTAVGATPRRIARQLLTESVLLAVLGAAVGLLLASQALAMLKLVMPSDTPRLHEVHLNWRALAFTAGLAAITGCAFGLAPVSKAMRIRLRAILDAGGRGGDRAVAGPVRAALTVAQIACAVLLVIAAGLLLRSLWGLSRTDPGFRIDGIVTARVSPAEATCAGPARCLAFYRLLETDLQGIAGVRHAALVNTPPLTRAVAKRSLEIEGYTIRGTESAPLFWLNVVSADYIRTMDIDLLAGRTFTTRDASGGPAVALVDSATAHRFWPGQNAVGKHVRFVGESHWRTVVGIVREIRAFDLTKSVPAWMEGTIYVPHSPAGTLEDGRIPAEMTLMLRTTMRPAQAAAVLRSLPAVSDDVVIADVQSMDAMVANVLAGPAATTSLLVFMAVLALVLGCVGVYGVLSFLVSRQTRDLGIRFALGAPRRNVFWLVIRQGAVLCLAGIAIGIAGALAVTRWLSSELYGVTPTDPVTFAVVAVVVSLVTLTACYVPTRRAMAVNPLILLRDQ